MLDVVVKVYKDGVLVSSYGAEIDNSNTTAILGKAVLGNMRLGEA